jgi:hypothetical protein
MLNSHVSLERDPLIIGEVSIVTFMETVFIVHMWAHVVVV